MEAAVTPAPLWFTKALAVAPARHRVMSEGAAIEALVWGAPDAPPVILLHGNTACAEWWSFIAPLLGEFRVIAISLSGHGNSGHRAAYDTAIFASDVLAVADALCGPAQAFGLVAHSAGGAVASQLALAHPARVGRILFLDSQFLPGPARYADYVPKPHKTYPDYHSARARFIFVPEQPVANGFIADWIASQSIRPVAGGYSWKFDTRLRGVFGARLNGPDLRAIACPVTYLRGALSVTVPAGDLPKLAALLPDGARMGEIPEAHHHVMLDQPLAVVMAIRLAM